MTLLTAWRDAWPQPRKRMFRRLWVLSSIFRKVFRAPGSAMLLLFLYPLYWAWVSLGLLLDKVFFREQRTNVRSLIVAGPPRCGSSFLQRYLVGVTGGRASLLWEELVPSLCWQRLLAPLVHRSLDKGVPEIDLGPAHTARLDLPEADDVSVFARHLDSFFYYVYGLSWSEEEFPEYADPSQRPADVAPRDLRWLRRAARRNRINGNTDLAILKSFSLGFALGDALSALDAPRIVYISRAPHETLPSSLSMVRSVLELRGLYSRTSEAARRRHIERIVLASLSMQRTAIIDLQRLPPDAVLVVRYEDLVADFASTITRVLSFAGVSVGAECAASIHERAASQRARRSEHHYSLEEFGLSEGRIRKQFVEIYDYFQHS